MGTPIYDIPVQRINGTPTTLSEYKGKVLLIVNVASKCGLTPQYEALETVYENYRERGLVVLGFPANEFMGQEPGTNEEIQEFCSTKFNVQFPMYSKIVVKGDGQHALYQFLTRSQPKATQKPGSQFLQMLAKQGQVPETESDIAWNFEKFLVSRNGDVVGRFAPDVAPDDPMVLKAVEAEIEKDRAF